MNDFYDASARKRYQVLEAAKARAIANLEEYRATGDEDSAAEELQTLATINDQQASLQRLHQQYHQQMQPPPAPRPDSWREKRTDEMTPQDVINMIQQGDGKHSKTMSAEDYWRGYQKLQQAKAAGDYSGKP
jgi:hypothetical protein